MYGAIASEFAGVTVLSVVHRLSHIGFYDRVCILERGEVAELGTPKDLMSKDSEFRDILNVGAEATVFPST